MISIACYCCCFLIAFFRAFFTWSLHKLMSQWLSTPICVLFHWFLMLSRNFWGKWSMWQNVQWGRSWQMGHQWWRWGWLFFFTMTFEVIVKKNRLKLRQVSKKWNIFNFRYCYVLLISEPSVVWRFFTRWFLKRVCISLNIWIIVCSEIPFSKNLHKYRNQSINLKSKSIDWFLYDTSFYWKMFPNRL